MASIASNPIFSAGANAAANNPPSPASPASSGANANAAAAGNANNVGGVPSDPAKDSKDPRAKSSSSSTFMQLVAGMIQGNTTPDQLPANLADLLLTGDSGEALDGLGLDDSDTTDPDDEDSDEAGAAAVAALLAGLQTFQPIPAANASGDDGQGIAPLTASGSQGTLQTLLDTSQAQLSAAIDGALADAGKADASATQDAPDAAPPTQSTSASSMQSLMQAHKAAETAPQAASAEVRTPVGTQGWSDELGTHLTIMAANGREAATLRLSPEHLGPLEIRISMKDGDASVTFGASNPETRNALEQSLPRLREMFASQGLVLGDANVSRDAPRDSFKPATFANATRGSSDAAADLGVKPITLSRLGLVDTYV